MEQRSRSGLVIAAVTATLAVTSFARAPRQSPSGSPHGATAWTRKLAIDRSDLATRGRNRYWILEPGYRIVLEGKGSKVAITVLDETVRVGSYTTRVVEEREWQNGQLVEVSRNFYAISRSTGDLFYFGEAVDAYRNGEITGHPGSWRAFVGQNRPGLMMPGAARLGMRYYQELAPGVAMDRAKIVSLDSTLDTPAGTTYEHCLETEESSALNTEERSTKIYAPDIGLILDDEVSVVYHGFTAKRSALVGSPEANKN
jgi:hypothetical protein